MRLAVMTGTAAMTVEDPGSQYTSDLWQTLIDRGRELAEQGLHDASVSVRREFVEVARRLAEQDSDGCLHLLAHSLVDLAHALRIMDRCEEAVTVAAEAISLARRVNHRDPRLFQSSDLARLLDALSSDQSLLGRNQDALSSAEDAVANWRELAAEEPDRHLGDLASALRWLSLRLDETGRAREALTVIAEAASVYSRLGPERLSDLVLSLGGLARLLNRTGARLFAFATITTTGCTAPDACETEPESLPRAKRDAAAQLIIGDVDFPRGWPSLTAFAARPSCGRRTVRSPAGQKSAEPPVRRRGKCGESDRHAPIGTPAQTGVAD